MNKCEKGHKLPSKLQSSVCGCINCIVCDTSLSMCKPHQEAKDFIDIESPMKTIGFAFAERKRKRYQTDFHHNGDHYQVITTISLLKRGKKE